MLSKSECGLTLNTRIIRGKEARPRHYPWLVAVMTEDEGECGGSLINDRYILTAAHCLIEKPTDGPAQMSDRSKTFVMLGAHTASQRVQEEKGQEKVLAENFYIHEQFNSTGNLEHDIALIKLKRPVDIEGKWTPICLQGAHLPMSNDLFVAGWGIVEPYNPNSEDRKYAEVLYESKINRVDDMLCLKYWDRTEFDPSKQFCAALKTCDGDSGGPVSVVSETQHRNIYQVGIVSYGTDDCGYFFHKPDVHTKVPAYLDWIEARTRDAKWCTACGTPQFTKNGQTGPQHNRPMPGPPHGPPRGPPMRPPNNNQMNPPHPPPKHGRMFYSLRPVPHQQHHHRHHHGHPNFVHH